MARAPAIFIAVNWRHKNRGKTPPQKTNTIAAKKTVINAPLEYVVKIPNRMRAFPKKISDEITMELKKSQGLGEIGRIICIGISTTLWEYGVFCDHSCWQTTWNDGIIPFFQL
jgi:hypothetical protein